MFGTITYRGPGYFLAGGAGVTPFIAIFRQLEHDNNLPGNHLLFSNKSEQDIILKGEFKRMLGKDAVFTLTQEERRVMNMGESMPTFYVATSMIFPSPSMCADHRRWWRRFSRRCKSSANSPMPWLSKNDRESACRRARRRKRGQSTCAIADCHARLKRAREFQIASWYCQ